jgi:hypothetical protein
MLVKENGQLAKWIVIGIIVGLAFIIFVAYFVVTPKVSRLEPRTGYAERTVVALRSAPTTAATRSIA